MKTKWFERMKKITAWVVIGQMLLALVPIATAYGTDTGFKSPTGSHIPNGWANKNDALTSNNEYAFKEVNGGVQGYGDFEFPLIPAGSIVNGVEVQIDAYQNDSGTDCKLGVELSWNDGATYTNPQKTLYPTGNDEDDESTLTFGGATDKWGRASWNSYDFLDTNFVLKIQSIDPSSDGDCGGGGSGDGDKIYVDWIRAKVYYTEATYSVDFHENSGSAVTDLSGLHWGDLIPKPADPTRTGYQFAGWYEDAGFADPWIFTGPGAETINGNQDLYAKWSNTNDAPVAVNNSYSTNEDIALSESVPGVLGNDTDADGDTLTAVLVSDVTNGTLVLNSNGSFQYTPNLNFNGIDTFTYKANDGFLDSNTATVTITVNPINDAPVAVGDLYITNEDTAINELAPGLLSNDSDVDLDPLSAVKVTDPTNGTVTLNANGSFTYTPNANYSGPDSFTYKANDGALDSNVVTVNITVNPVNDAPVAVDNSYSTNEDIALNGSVPGVLGNDTDADGDTLTAVLVSDVTNGTLVLNSNGSFQYTPNLNFNGIDTFTYKANDGFLDSNTATVTITVNPINDAPVANPQDVITPEDTPLPITLTGNDNEGDALTYEIVVGPAHGALTGIAPNLTYTPNPDYNGPDSFTFRVFDGTTYGEVATVGITVSPVDDPLPPIVPTPPTILTPILAAAPVIAAPAAVAAPEVLGEETVEEVAEVPEEKEVKGSSDKICPWWWIIGLVLLAALGFTGGVIKAEDQDSRIRKYFYLWPPIFGGVAWLLHLWLHNDFKATWFCDNYWLVVLLIALVAEVVFRFLARGKRNS